MGKGDQTFSEILWKAHLSPERNVGVQKSGPGLYYHTLSLTFFRLRNHFLATEVDKLATQYAGLNKQYLEKKNRLGEVKAEQARLRAEKVECEARAGMVANIDMLRDFTITEEALAGQIKTNEDMKRRLGWWWEGFKKSGENI